MVNIPPNFLIPDRETDESPDSSDLIAIFPSRGEVQVVSSTTVANLLRQIPADTVTLAMLTPGVRNALGGGAGLDMGTTLPSTGTADEAFLLTADQTGITNAVAADGTTAKATAKAYDLFRYNSNDKWQFVVNVSTSSTDVEANPSGNATRTLTKLQIEDVVYKLAAAAADISVDASGFDGNLETTDNTAQKVAQKLDDLNVSGSGNPRGAGAGLTLDGNNLGVNPGDGIEIDSDKVTVDLDGTTLSKSSSGLKLSDGVPRFRGAWAANTAYIVGDVAVNGDNVQLCKTANNDATFTQSKWYNLTEAFANLTGAEIVTLLEALAAGSRLSYNKLDDTPEIPTIDHELGNYSYPTGVNPGALTAGQLVFVNQNNAAQRLFYIYPIASKAEFIGFHWNVGQEFDVGNARIRLETHTLPPTKTGNEYRAHYSVVAGTLPAQGASNIRVRVYGDVPADRDLADVAKSGKAADVSVDASGFDGNLATTDNTAQKVAQKLDDLNVSGSGNPRGAGDGLGLDGNDLDVKPGDAIEIDNDKVTVHLDGTTLSKSSSGLQVTHPIVDRAIDFASSTSNLPIADSGEIVFHAALTGNSGGITDGVLSGAVRIVIKGNQTRFGQDPGQPSANFDVSFTKQLDNAVNLGGGVEFDIEEMNDGATPTTTGRTAKVRAYNISRSGGGYTLTDLVFEPGGTARASPTTFLNIKLYSPIQPRFDKLRKATQAEAEAGTENTAYMTALRVKEAIDEFEHLNETELQAVFDSVFDNSLLRTFTNVLQGNKNGDAILTEPTGVSQDRELGIDYEDKNGTSRENWLGEIGAGNWVYIVKDTNTLLFKVEAASNDDTNRARKFLWTNANAYAVGSWPSNLTLSGDATFYFTSRDLTDHLLTTMSNLGTIADAAKTKLRDALPTGTEVTDESLEVADDILLETFKQVTVGSLATWMFEHNTGLSDIGGAGVFYTFTTPALGAAAGSITDYGTAQVLSIRARNNSEKKSLKQKLVSGKQIRLEVSANRWTEYTTTADVGETQGVLNVQVTNKLVSGTALGNNQSVKLWVRSNTPVYGDFVNPAFKENVAGAAHRYSRTNGTGNMVLEVPRATIRDSDNADKTLTTEMAVRTALDAIPTLADASIEETAEVSNPTVGGAWTNAATSLETNGWYSVILIEETGDNESLMIGPVKFGDINTTFISEESVSEVDFPQSDYQENLTTTVITGSFVTFVTSAAITPRSASSKFVLDMKGVAGSINIAGGGLTGARGDLQVQRKIGTGSWTTISGLSKNYVFLANFGNPPFGYGPIEDSPNTTEAVQYRCQLRRVSTGEHAGGWNCEAFFLALNEVVPDPDTARSLRIRRNGSNLQYRLEGDVAATSKLRVLKHVGTKGNDGAAGNSYTYVDAASEVPSSPSTGDIVEIRTAIASGLTNFLNTSDNAVTSAKVNETFEWNGTKWKQRHRFHANPIGPLVANSAAIVDGDLTNIGTLTFTIDSNAPTGYGVDGNAQNYSNGANTALNVRGQSGNFSILRARGWLVYIGDSGGSIEKMAFIPWGAFYVSGGIVPQRINYDANHHVEIGWNTEGTAMVFTINQNASNNLTGKYIYVYEWV